MSRAWGRMFCVAGDFLSLMAEAHSQTNCVVAFSLHTHSRSAGQSILQLINRQQSVPLVLLLQIEPEVEMLVYRLPAGLYT